MSNNIYIKIPLQNIINVSRIATVHYYDLAPGFINPGEKHDFWEMVYVDGGNAFYKAKDRSGQLRSGQVIFHRPKEFHSLWCDGKKSATVFVIGFYSSSPAIKFFSGKVLNTGADMAQLIKKIISESEKTFVMFSDPIAVKEDAPIGGQQLIKGYMEEFLLLLMRAEENKAEVKTVFTSEESMKNTIVADMCRYLSEKAYDRVTLEEISEKFHFGKSYLCELFKKNTGYSILNYHTELKMKEAKRLLREENLSIKEISDSLKFESPAYFSRCFSKHVGKSPRSYRKMLMNTATVKR